MAQQKTSFIKSVLSGITGFVKGAVTGGVVGAVSGAAVGAVVGLLTGGVGAAGAAALVGLGYGAPIFAWIGGLTGMATGVVHSREPEVSAQDVVNVANIAFAQGVQVGHEMTVAHGQQAEAESRRWRAMEEQRRAQITEQQRQH